VNTRYIAEELRMSHWAGIMRNRQESGLSIRAYCETAGFHENVYYYWQRKLREAACKVLSDKTSELIFKPQNEAVKDDKSIVPSDPRAPHGWAICEATETKEKGKSLPIEIGGCRVLADSDVNPELLAKVCRVLLSLC